MRAVWDNGQPLVDDPYPLAGVSALGVDGHVRQHAGRPRRGRGFGTGIVDITPGRPPRLLGVAGTDGIVLLLPQRGETDYVRNESAPGSPRC